MKPIAKRPFGESKLGGYAGKYWNNCHRGTDGPVVCGMCGTEHPEDKDNSYIISRFFGLEVVEDCCGAAIDRVYRESGEEFAIRFLEEFAKNPTDSRFSVLLIGLKRIFPEALKKLTEVKGQVEEIAEQVVAMSR